MHPLWFVLPCPSPASVPISRPDLTHHTHTQGIQIADFYLTKHQHLDLPALYQPHARYHYSHGANWRAVAALLAAIVPALPGLAAAVNPSLHIGGARYVAQFNWYYGFCVALGVYAALSWIVPCREALVGEMVWGERGEEGGGGGLEEVLGVAKGAEVKVERAE